MDLLTHLVSEITNAVRNALSPKIEAVAGKVEAASHQIELLRSDIAKLSAKVDKLGAGSPITAAQLATLTQLTGQLRVSAATLKSAVAANPNP